MSKQTKNRIEANARMLVIYGMSEYAALSMMADLYWDCHEELRLAGLLMPNPMMSQPTNE